MIDPRQFAAEEPGSRLSIVRLLYAVLGAPILWALHISAVYFLLTLDCISAWEGGRWAVAVVTIAFAAASAGAGWTARAMHRRLPRAEEPSSHEGDRGSGDPEWTRFLLVVGMGAAAIFTAVIVLEGLSPFLTDLCP